MAPTVDVTHTGQEHTIDGVRIVFQVTPGTEAPAEMNFFFPDRSALCMAENATHTLHQLLTLRGAEVRDAARLVALPAARRSAVRATRPTSSSPRTTGRSGAPSRSPRS